MKVAQQNEEDAEEQDRQVAPPLKEPVAAPLKFFSEGDLGVPLRYATTELATKSDGIV